MNEIETVESICTICDLRLRFYWVKDKGFLSRPSITLVANSVFHTECWDKMVEENPVD